MRLLRKRNDGWLMTLFLNGRQSNIHFIQLYSLFYLRVYIVMKTYIYFIFKNNLSLVKFITDGKYESIKIFHSRSSISSKIKSSTMYSKQRGASDNRIIAIVLKCTFGRTKHISIFYTKMHVSFYIFRSFKLQFKFLDVFNI